jgi:hypothetical protein
MLTSLHIREQLERELQQRRMGLRMLIPREPVSRREEDNSLRRRGVLLRTPYGHAHAHPRQLLHRIGEDAVGPRAAQLRARRDFDLSVQRVELGGEGQTEKKALAKHGSARRVRHDKLEADVRDHQR